MGGTASVQTEQVNRAVSEAIINTASQCESAAKAAIGITVDGGSGDVDIGGSITQGASSSTVNCQQEDQIDELMKNNLAQSLSQTAKNEGFSLWGRASSNSKTTTEAISKMNLAEMKKCAPQDDASLNLLVKNHTGNVSWTPVVSQIAKAQCEQCVQGNKVLQENAQSVVSVINSSASNGMTFGLFAMIIALAVIAAIGAAVVAFLTRNKGAAAGATGGMPGIPGSGSKGAKLGGLLGGMLSSASAGGGAAKTAKLVSSTAGSTAAGSTAAGSTAASEVGTKVAAAVSSLAAPAAPAPAAPAPVITVTPVAASTSPLPSTNTSTVSSASAPAPSAPAPSAPAPQATVT